MNTVRLVAIKNMRKLNDPQEYYDFHKGQVIEVPRSQWNGKEHTVIQGHGVTTKLDGFVELDRRSL